MGKGDGAAGASTARSVAGRQRVRYVAPSRPASVAHRIARGPPRPGLLSYDRYGNLLAAPDATGAVTSYARDEANRLTTITPPGANPAATFTIDPIDRHATRVVSGVTDTYGYTGPTETTFETSATGTRSLLDVDGSRLAVKNGSTVAWVIFDLHGSVAALCPAGGTTLSDAYRYDGWGQKVATSGTSINPWKYRGLLGIAPGSIVDQLYDMGARDYAPALGAFTQFDSVQGDAANPLSMNRFLYALANPATLIDPDGHRPLAACDPDCGAGYDSRADTQLWHKKQQHERMRQTRIAKWRQTTGCHRTGECYSPRQAQPNSGCYMECVEALFIAEVSEYAAWKQIEYENDRFLWDQIASAPLMIMPVGAIDDAASLSRDASAIRAEAASSSWWSRLRSIVAPIRGAATNASGARSAPTSGARFIVSPDGKILDLGVRPGPNPLVVIGEDMSRVTGAANRMGGEWYKPPQLATRGQQIAYDRYWTREMMSQGRVIVDKGPAPGRVMYPGATSDFYGAELREIALKNYSWYYPCWSC